MSEYFMTWMRSTISLPSCVGPSLLEMNHRIMCIDLPGMLLPSVGV
jgi:hypothetical protein